LTGYHPGSFHRSDNAVTCPNSQNYLRSSAQLSQMKAGPKVKTSALPRRIGAFCETRIAPIAAPDLAASISSYLIGLVVFKSPPPAVKGRWNWVEIEGACEAKSPFSVNLRRNLQPALDLINRWVKDHRSAEAEQVFEPAKELVPRVTKVDPKPKRAVRRHGYQPRPIEAFPEALFDLDDDPSEFPEPLRAQMERHGDTAWHLHRAVVDPEETFDRKTLYNWLVGDKTPRSVASFEILRRVEQRYRLPEGYFKRKLPHKMRAATGHYPGMEIGPAERRRLAWHLPDDFNSLPRSKRDEIIEWVRRVIITGATEYRRYQAAATRQHFGIKFPFSDSFQVNREPDDDDDGREDATTTNGKIDSPLQLAEELADLIRFKTATLTAIGFHRNKVWGAETTAQKVEHFGLMFGALAASPSGSIRGRGVPLSHLTFALLAFPGIWDWYIQWRERRRGFYTTWEINMLSSGLELTRYKTGWLRQNPQLLDRVQPIPGVLSATEIEAARANWNETCDGLYQHAINRLKEIQRVARVHRDPFEPVMTILESSSPLAEYKKITDEILNRFPDDVRHPVAAAEAVRSFLMLRLGLHLGLRQKNLRQLMVCSREDAPRTERQLNDMKRGEMRWSERDSGWEVLIPSNAFKNATSSFFGSKPYRLVLRDFSGLYAQIDAYINNHRAKLLRGAKDPGTLFVKTVKATSRNAEYDQTTFYEAWRLTIARYGIYNPYTGRGAIKGLLPHGPHNVRDVLATHVLKKTGSYEQASYAIQDTPEMVRKHYGRFLPEDKAALAARILNQVWESDDINIGSSG
jgi:hypothetical protein